MNFEVSSFTKFQIFKFSSLGEAYSALGLAAPSSRTPPRSGAEASSPSMWGKNFRPLKINMDRRHWWPHPSLWKLAENKRQSQRRKAIQLNATRLLLQLATISGLCDSGFWTFFVKSRYNAFVPVCQHYNAHGFIKRMTRGRPQMPKNTFLTENWAKFLYFSAKNPAR